MNLEINIKLDNAAFEPSTGAEVARILRRYADSIEDQDAFEDGDRFRFLDVNGNHVGDAKVSD